jgi:hypothetical protein
MNIKLLSFFILLASIAYMSESHVIMLKPASRASAWRIYPNRGFPIVQQVNFEAILFLK